MEMYLVDSSLGVKSEVISFCRDARCSLMLVQKNVSARVLKFVPTPENDNKQILFQKPNQATKFLSKPPNIT